MDQSFALPLSDAATTVTLQNWATGKAAAPKSPSCEASTVEWPDGEAAGLVAAAKALRDSYSRPHTSPLAAQHLGVKYSHLDIVKDGASRTEVAVLAGNRT